MRHHPDPEDYDNQEYAPPPRQAPAPQPAFRPNPRAAAIARPAPVHYASLGLELAGDYKFGYDTGKGNEGQSFREETRLPDGTVQGAYGYVDETGRQRIVKYTAGKDGFKAEGDIGPEGAPQAAPRSSAPAPQPSYAPQPQPAPRPQPQPVYRQPPPPPPAQPRQRPQPQPAYRAPEPAAYRPQPQPAYRAPEPAPRPRSQPRPAPRPVESYEGEPDYDYPNNGLEERRLVPVDTSLFNYNIGSSHNSKK